MLQALFTSRPTSAGREAYTLLSAALTQAFPATCPSLLFKDESISDADAKPFSYLFISLLLIDLRSSFPTLLTQLNSTEYPNTSRRLAAAFDVISSFIGYLVRILDDSNEVVSASIPPELLLKLRKEISETISLTIEYLRDRWDASVAGAAGLHPSARPSMAATSEGTRLTLTWDSKENNIDADPLILSAIRALAIWAREDENENLRNESAGLMDMLMELYKTSYDGRLEFRLPVLVALMGITATEQGTNAFLEQDGWGVLFGDLESIFLERFNKRQSNLMFEMNEATRGLEAVRVLLMIVDHPSMSFPREEWMKAITMTASLKPVAGEFSSSFIELQISMLQLSTALLSKSTVGMQRRYASSNAALTGLAHQLVAAAKLLENKTEAAELGTMLEDVLTALEDLGIA
jgi:hypothetical protein